MKRTNGKHWRLAIFAGLVSITFAALTARAGGISSTGPNTPGAGGNKEHRTEAFVAALDAAGFTVREGSIVLTDILYAVNDYFIDSGAGGNAGQFYKRWVVPALPGQTDTPQFLFRLNPDEAVVYGVNHVATGITTYSSLAVYGEWQLNHLPLQPGEPKLTRLGGLDHRPDFFHVASS